VPRPDAVAASVEQPLPDAVSTLEKSMIARALQMTDGRVDDAARLLGISRKGLFLKRKRYGLS
jgi:DNA-binding NtrC family response regulator